MAQRRPIASHPAFAPFVALWFAALFGLILAVLPSAIIEAVLGAAGLPGAVPLALATRLAVCAAAAALGAMIGWALGKLLARRASLDPRPQWDEADAAMPPPPSPAAVRRPLRIHEELPETGFTQDGGDAGHEAPGGADPEDSEARPAVHEFMILAPKPPPPANAEPAPDLDALLAQFDHAIAGHDPDMAERLLPDAGEDALDPVQAFLARQTGSPGPAAFADAPPPETAPLENPPPEILPPETSLPESSPLGGRLPDHQAALRIALDKLAHFRRNQG